MDDASATGSADTGRIPGSYKRAFFLGVLNGALWQMGMSFMEPSTVLPAFVNELTQSRLAVGIVSAVALAGWMLPQLVVANYVQVMPRKLPVYRAMAVVRMMSLCAVIASLYLLGGNPRLLLPLFVLFFAMFTFAGGAGGISFMDVVAKTIPPYRIGSFFGQRQLYGGVLGIAAAVVVRYVLREESALVFPRNYMHLFIMGAAAIGAGVLCFALINEPPGAV
ncbi:MAG: MFS transporter, partial [Armatimonadota bacterium]